MVKDKKLSDLIKKETERQEMTLDLIASENIAPKSVRDILGSVLVNKYSEGYPGKRYYPGNSNYDEIEKLTVLRALGLFKLSAKKWHVNTQAYSGAIANMAIYLSVLKPGDTILSLQLSSGGHLSHGSKASFTGKLFNTVCYKVDEEYRISYAEIEFLAKKVKPAMIVSGASAYPFAIDFNKIGAIAKKVGAYYLADISHYAGLVSAGFYPSPFESSDFVMTTTHKSLMGPRGAIIFANKNSLVAKKLGNDIVVAIDKAVFPGLQGGPHNHSIAAIANGLFLSKQTQAKKYYRQVVLNAKTLSSGLIKSGFKIVGGGTESHMLLINTLSLGMGGFEAEKLLEKSGILANRNTISGDSSPLHPSAIRIGTYSTTYRGMKEKEMILISGFLNRILIKKENPLSVKKDVIKLCKKFPV